MRGQHHRFEHLQHSGDIGSDGHHHADRVHGDESGNRSAADSADYVFRTDTMYEWRHHRTRRGCGDAGAVLFVRTMESGRRTGERTNRDAGDMPDGTATDAVAQQRLGDVRTMYAGVGRTGNVGLRWLLVGTAQRADGRDDRNERPMGSDNGAGDGNIVAGTGDIRGSGTKRNGADGAGKYIGIKCF